MTCSRSPSRYMLRTCPAFHVGVPRTRPHPNTHAPRLLRAVSDAMHAGSLSVSSMSQATPTAPLACSNVRSPPSSTRGNAAVLVPSAGAADGSTAPPLDGIAVGAIVKG